MTSNNVTPFNKFKPVHPPFWVIAAVIIILSLFISAIYSLKKGIHDYNCSIYYDNEQVEHLEVRSANIDATKHLKSGCAQRLNRCNVQRIDCKLLIK